MSEVTVVDPRSFRRDELEPAVRALRAGALVALPTETIYGVFAREGDEPARERLRALQGAETGWPLAVQVGSVEQALSLVAPAPPRLLPLVRRFWPGPLTVVLRREDGSEIAVRVPAHPVAVAFLALVGAPVVAAAPSPNGSPLHGGAEVREALATEVDWIVDGGETSIKEPSTVVRVWTRGWECLREGIVSREMLARHLTTTVLFVCTGNSCRSPMAEAMLRRKLAQRLGIGDDQVEEAGFRVCSAGTSTLEGQPASAGAVQAMEERAIPLSRHRSRPVSQELVEGATLVIAMSPTHLQSVTRWWPEHRAKVQVIDELGIVDPIGGPPELYRECASMIDARLDAVVARLLAGECTPESLRATS